MGRAKQDWIEAEERGWNEPDGFVCSDCVEDTFLKEAIQFYACQRVCDYCGRRTRSHSAAPVSDLMNIISHTVKYYFNEPSDAGVPYEGGYLVDPIDTEEMLMELPLECNDELFEEIKSAFIDSVWVRSAYGHWASSHAHEVLCYSWDSFVRIVKHQKRYFFHEDTDFKSYESEQYDPRHLLPAIGKIVSELNLIKQIPAETGFFRVRERMEGEIWAPIAKELGAPPAELTRSGRMNPAGISYLYLAFEHQTAIAEALHSAPCVAVIATFKAQHELSVLDLTSIPNLPSIFDHNARDTRESLIFLERFVSEISEPIEKDGREHFEYVPSQIVSEYFALIFQHNEGHHIDGIMYPSSVRAGGNNLVLFPSKRGFERNFDQVAFQSAQELSITEL